MGLIIIDAEDVPFNFIFPMEVLISLVENLVIYTHLDFPQKILNQSPNS